MSLNPFPVSLGCESQYYAPSEMFLAEQSEGRNRGQDPVGAQPEMGTQTSCLWTTEECQDHTREDPEAELEPWE